MTAYFEEFRILERTKEQTPLGERDSLVFGPPVTGLFAQSRSDEAMEAGTEATVTRGRFITHAETPVCGKDILRRESDGALFELVGTPSAAPCRASVRLKVFTAGMCR